MSNESESGGVMATVREYFRAEVMARFALSAFGPATAVEVKDDHGIDLFCATAKRDGKRLRVGQAYCVQVRAKHAPICLEGPGAYSWLFELGSPYLICIVDMATTRIRIYSTWSLSRLLLHAIAFGHSPPNSIRLVPDLEVTTDEVTAEAVPLGPPILDFALSELGDDRFREKLRVCLAAWVRVDSENVARRHSGLTIARGYTRWTTNEPPTDEHRYRPHYYGPAAVERARALIVEAAAVIATYEGAIHNSPCAETAALRAYARGFCNHLPIEQWTRDLLGLR